MTEIEKRRPCEGRRQLELKYPMALNVARLTGIFNVQIAITHKMCGADGKPTPR